MIRAFVLALAQLTDPPVLGVLAKSVALTLAIFAAAGALVWWGSSTLLEATVGAAAGTIATVFAVAVTALALWLTFRAVALMIVGLFADTIVAAVERRHYPAAVPRPVSAARQVRMGIGSAVRFVGVNLLLAPGYVALLATGVGAPALFLVVNAWLLGRDLGDMVAVRHLPADRLADWRRATAARRFLLGLAATGLFVVPFLNLLAPVVGAAMATHLFHRKPT